MATAGTSDIRLLGQLPALVERAVTDIGDLALFAYRVVTGITRRVGRSALLPVCYAIGVQSIPVVAITGMFIGMVLAVQSFAQFQAYGLATRLGEVVNVSVVRELGPVLAAVMLAGRVGGAMAAELATMRITEQIDALSCLGVNPIHYLAAPRFLACVLLIPLLTIIADFAGVLGGAIVSIRVLNIEAHFYWRNSEGLVTMFDIFTGLTKSMFFGAAIAAISCHRGFQGDPGATGVGSAATRAFVASFIAILALDFFLGLVLVNVHDLIWR